MVVKGRSIQSFGGNMEVANYPMRERSPEELAELQYVMQQRAMEEIDSEIRRNTFPPEIASYSPLIGTQSCTHFVFCPNPT